MRGEWSVCSVLVLNYSRMKRRSDEKKSKVLWSAAEDDRLLKAVLEDKQDRDTEVDAEDEEDWDEIAKIIPGKTPVQCLKRYMVINRRKSGEPSPASTIATTKTEAVKSSQEEDSKIASREEEKEEAPDEEDEEEDEEEEKEQKRARKEGETSTRWPQDDIDLLKKLVENYKDCKSMNVLFLFLFRSVPV